VATLAWLRKFLPFDKSLSMHGYWRCLILKVWGLARGSAISSRSARHVPLKQGDNAFTMAAGGKKVRTRAVMIFEHIEKLKKQYTDKYVVVDESRPELKRFRGLTGNVKTINMSGRALVEFDGYNNIGWFDIDPTFLKVVDTPPPKPAESHRDKAAAPKAESPKAPGAAAKPVGEKKTPAAAAAKPATAAKPAAGKSVAEILAAARKPASEATATAAAPVAEAKPASAAPAGKVAPGGKGMSMAEILAAARGKTAPAAAPAAAQAAAPAAEKAAPPPKPAAPPKAAPAAASSASPAKVAPGGKGMSMEDILAMARGKKPAAPAAAVAAAPPLESPAEEPPAEAKAEEAAAAAVEQAAPVASTLSGEVKSLKDSITSVAEQVAYCRRVDAKK
jgi:hypothetical protein